MNADGYSIAVAQGELDADEFVVLEANGRAQLAGGEAAAAAHTLQAALELWRGAALAEFATEPWAAAAASALEEQRVTAVEQRIEAELGLGASDHVGLEPVACR